MTDPQYEPGRARPEPPGYPVDPYKRTPPYPMPRPEPPRPRVSAGRLWAGGLGTAVVVALVIVVGVLLVRGVLGIPVLSAEGEGTYGSASTTVYAFSGAVIAIVATGLLHLLLLVMPRPLQFFHWITGLATAVAVLLPMTLSAEWDARIATAAINLVAGVALITVLGSVGSASRIRA